MTCTEPKWKSLLNEIPRVDTPILVARKWHIEIASYMGLFTFSSVDGVISGVTHWMYLPEMPKKQKITA